MKALTVRQPFASLIMLPDSDPRHKRTENRIWTDAYRGPLLIHAGKSRGWIEPSEEDSRIDEEGLPIADLVFGVILGVVDVIDHLPQLIVETKYPKLYGHRYIEGPYCIVVSNVRPFARGWRKY